MYDKLESMREVIDGLDIDTTDKKYLLNTIDDIEHELEVQDGAADYLRDEDNYE